ncbi:hypothetical protein HDU67_008623 [Dinochytrium kinnereticum]|nr:hypothetical protein HDU67_008623 [Dinochytrium kinnereticum]
MTKVYGIDWNPLSEKEIITCSQDQTIKFWDIDDPRNCKGTIFTAAPVWRARFTPFGTGILTMPQRKDYDLTLWSSSNHSDPVYSFKGHTDVVREFVWRVKDEPEPAYQLVTWSKDQTLRLWPVSGDVLSCVGHQERPSSRSNRISIPPPILGEGLSASAANSAFASPNSLEPQECGFAQVWANSETVMLNDVTEPSFSKNGPNPATVAQALALTVENDRRKDENGLEVFGNKGDLSYQVSLIRNKFPTASIERVDVSRRMITIGFQRALNDLPGGSAAESSGTKSAFLRVHMVFPSDTEKIDSPTFEIAKTSTFPALQRNHISSKISSIISYNTARGESSFEPCMRYLLFGEQVLGSESTTSIKSRRSSSVNAGLFSLGTEMTQYVSPSTQSKNVPSGTDVLSKSLDESVSSNDEELNQITNRLSVKNDQKILASSQPHETSNVPYPRLCGATFSLSGKLVCFFSPIPHPHAVRYTAYTISTRNQQPVLQPQLFPIQPKSYGLYENYRTFLVERFPQLVKFRIIATANDKGGGLATPSGEIKNGEIQKVLNHFGNSVDYWFDGDDDDDGFSNNQILGNLMIGSSYAPPPYAVDLQSRLQTALKLPDKSHLPKRAIESSVDSDRPFSTAPGSVPLSPAAGPKSLKLEKRRERGLSITTGDTSTSSLFESAVPSLGQSAVASMASLNSADSWSTPPSGSIASRRGTMFSANSESITNAIAARRHRRSRSFHEASRTGVEGEVESGGEGDQDWKVQKKESKASLVGSLASSIGKERRPSVGVDEENQSEESLKDSYDIKVRLLDVAHLLPVSDRLARLYRVIGEDPVALCEHNKSVAEGEGRSDLAKVWKVAGVILSDHAASSAEDHIKQPKQDLVRKPTRRTQKTFKIESYDNDDVEYHYIPPLGVAQPVPVNDARSLPKGRFIRQGPSRAELEGPTTSSKSQSGMRQHSFNPMGRELIHSIFTNLELCGDFQTLALLCCIFSEPNPEEESAIIGIGGKPIDHETLGRYLRRSFPAELSSKQKQRLSGQYPDRDNSLSYGDIGYSSSFSWSEPKLSGGSIVHSQAMGIQGINEHHAAAYLTSVMGGQNAASFRNNSWEHQQSSIPSSGSIYSAMGGPITESPASFELFRSSMPRDRPLQRNFLGSRNELIPSYPSRGGLQLQPHVASDALVPSRQTYAQSFESMPTSSAVAKQQDAFPRFIGDASSSLLDPNICHVYDRFLLLYADFLFNVGLLEERIYILKALNLWKLGFIPGTPTTIEFEIHCPCKSRKAVDIYCPSCKPHQSPPKRVVCAICNLPCKSLVTCCMECGHGGHVAHMRAWFSKAENKTCPAACGCHCLVAASRVIPE